jgi:GDP-fucose protein O-fucosyltransferase
VRRLFVPGYYSGFSNNKMSLDIAIALAYLTGRVLVPYRFRLHRRFPVDLPPDRVLEPMLVPDLFDIPVPYSDEYLFKTWISVPGALHCAWTPVFESVFCCPATLPTDDARFQHFCNGRWYVYSFSEQQDEAPDLHINTHMLGHYSYFFYLDEERRRLLVDLMRRVRPKQPYSALADHIAASFGRFNAIHLRRDDFVQNEISRMKITRAASISGQEIVANLASRMRRDDPLVICTDGSSREEIFGPIQKYFRETIFLDRYLRENTSIREMMSQLPRNDESVVALLTQLVASKARVFAGTLFSTFTALIHRLRGFASHESNFLYCYNDFLSPLVRFDRCEFLPVDDGPYSWNRIRYPVSPDAYSWLREWPESFNSAPPPFEAEVPTPGTLDLCASDAAVHGSTIRCLEEGGSQMMIGDWTDQNAFVTWDFMLAAGGTYAVEIRYACPEDSSGSRYGVGIEGAEELRGHVWNTGSWAALSPWLPLGRLRIPAGRSRLIVRAIEKDSYAVMNLSAVRLVPTKLTA